MSLSTDRIFFEAIKADETVMDKIGGRIYNPAIPLPDEDLTNAPIPYAIVMFEGLRNAETTKDDFESEYDYVTIGIELAAKTRDELAELSEQVRAAVRSFLENCDDEELEPLIPYDYTFTADRVMYDPLKPCCYTTMHYECYTNV